LRYIVKFQRLASVRFISHLELMRCLHRALRRSGIKVSYTEGYNPQIRMSFAFAMPVGLISYGEYFDIRLEDGQDGMSPHAFTEILNSHLPDGIRILDCVEATDKTPHLSALVQYAEYEVSYKKDYIDAVKGALCTFMAQDNITVSVQTKKGFKEQDIKRAIVSFDIKEQGADYITLRLRTAMSEQLSVKASVVVNEFNRYCGFTDENASATVRTDFYSINDSGAEVYPLDSIRGTL